MRASRSIRACAVAAPLALFLTASSAVADQTIATVAAPTPISAFAGRVVWSAFDPAKGTYRLMTETGGAVTAVPVPLRRAPFDVDLGPDRSGNTVAAYSRCRREPPRRNPAIGNAIAQMPDWSRGRGCDLYRFDFSTGLERKIASASSARASEFLPSIWKSRIAFARVYERRNGPAGDRAYLYVRALAGPRGSLRVPAGSRSSQKFCTTKPQRCRLLLEPGPTALDLAERRLAFGWDSGGPTSSVYLGTVGVAGTRKRLIERVDSGDIQGREIVAPVLLDGQLVWMLTSFGDETSNVSQRYANGELSQAAIPQPPADPYLRPVLANAADGQTLFHLDSGLVPVGEPCSVQSPCIADPGCSAQQPCELRTTENLTYSPAKR